LKDVSSAGQVIKMAGEQAAGVEQARSVAAFASPSAAAINDVNDGIMYLDVGEDCMLQLRGRYCYAF
jgi:hypothetical protein